jgi:hypothetical protein
MKYKYSVYKYAYAILFTLSLISTAYFAYALEVLYTIFSVALAVAFFELMKIYDSFEKFINEE